MFGPPAQITAFAICELLKVTLHEARGFAGAETRRSAGSGTAARNGWLASGVQIHVPEALRTTRVPQQPKSFVYPPLEDAKYVFTAALFQVTILPAVSATARSVRGPSAVTPA